jgi:hypothetical protein
MNGKHRKRDTETSDYVAMMLRILNTWGDRIAVDPAALVHMRELETGLRDATNRGIFEANKGRDHYSRRDIAAILGMSEIGVMKRIRLGEMAYAAMQQRRGAGALVRIGDIRRTRADLLAAANVTDVTGSERERKAV